MSIESGIQTQDIPGRFDSLPSEHGSQVSMNITVVASRGAIGDWAAYYGNGLNSVPDVAKYGHKLTREAARQLFPNISGAYRD